MSASAGWRFATATHRSTQSCAPSRRSVRAVVSAGWGGLAHGDLPPSVFALDEVPHDRLFPAHGGHRPSRRGRHDSAALRAGKPSIVTPFIVGQFAWARLLAARGLAPESLPHRAMTADAPAVAIKTALDDGAMRERAAAIGETVRAENGLAHAVAAIERIGRR
jgi:sterol 3beta-glucosyltransferase